MDQFSWFSYVSTYIEESNLPLNWRPNTNSLDWSKRIDDILKFQLAGRKNICIVQRLSAPYFFKGCMNLATIADEKYERQAIRKGVAAMDSEFDTEYHVIIYPRGNFGIIMDQEKGNDLRREKLEEEYQRLEKGGFIFLDVLEGTGVLKKELGIFSNMHFLEGTSTYVKAFGMDELTSLTSPYNGTKIYRIERPLETRLAAIIEKT